MLTLIPLLLSMVQEPPVITCTVLKPDKSVTCKTGDRSVTYIISDWSEEKLDEWRWTPPYRKDHRDQMIVNPDGPPTKTELRRGQQVKARIVNGELVPVRSCDMRLYSNVVGHQSWTTPDYCQPWYKGNR